MGAKPIRLLTIEVDHVAGLEPGAEHLVNRAARAPGASGADPRATTSTSSYRKRGRARRRRDHRAATRRRRGGGHRASTTDRCRSLPVEFDVLLTLAREADTVVTREDLGVEVAGTPYDGIDRGMDIRMIRLRRKLQRSGLDPSRLESVRGVDDLWAGL